MFVRDDLYQDFVGRLADRVAKLRVAVAYSDDVEVGPMVSAEHAERVRGYIAEGVRDGSQLVTGGTAPLRRSAVTGSSSPPPSSRTP